MEVTNLREPKMADRVAAVLRRMFIRGEIAEHTTQGADEHINQLSLKYDNEPWKYREGQKRIIFKIKPNHFDPH